LSSSERETNLSLLVPGLLDAAGIDSASLPRRPNTLAALLSKADAEPFSATDLAEGIAQLRPDLPAECLDAAAALRYLDDTGRRPSGYCLAADPVHLQVGREQVIMGQHQGMEITSAESAALRELLEAELIRRESRLEVIRPNHWYLFLEHPPQARFATGRNLGGQGIRDHMPSGPDAGPWRTLISDAQILLHDCALNGARAAQGKPPINSLWLWGGGMLADNIDTSRHWRRVASDDPILRGLARLTGCEQVSALPMDFEADVITDDSLIVIDSIANPPPQLGIEVWWQALLDIDCKWLQPIAAALSEGKLATLTLIPLDGQSYRITRRQLRRWWKRQRPIDYFMSARNRI